MLTEPLKGKTQRRKNLGGLEPDTCYHEDVDIKFAVKWILQISERKIENLIRKWKNLGLKFECWHNYTWIARKDVWDKENEIIKDINKEYEFIMRLQQGFEDVL